MKKIIKVIKSDEIAIPEKEERLGIRNADWNRIKRRISRIPPSYSYLRTWYSILFGVGGSAAVTIIPLKFTTNTPDWIIVLYVTTSIFSLLLSIFLVILEKKLNKDRKSYNKDIIEDIKEVEKHLKK